MVEEMVMTKMLKKQQQQLLSRNQWNHLSSSFLFQSHLRPVQTWMMSGSLPGWNGCHLASSRFICKTALDYNRCRTHVHVPPFPLVHMIASFLTFFQTHNSPHLFHFCPNLVTAFSYLSLVNQKPIEVVFQYASCSDHRPGRLVKVPQAPKLLHAYSRTGFQTSSTCMHKL